MALIGCDSIGPAATRAIPVLEKYEPSWAVEPVNCDEKRSAPEPVMGCVVNSYTCDIGEEIIIEGTTIGGQKKFGDKFWSKTECTPAHENYENSPEAIYQLTIAADVEALFRLDSNCADLVPFAMSWNETRCPTIKHEARIIECEMAVKKRAKSFRVTTVNKAQKYMIGVDGQHGAEGNFRLSIKCGKYR